MIFVEDIKVCLSFAITKEQKKSLFAYSQSRYLLRLGRTRSLEGRPPESSSGEGK